MDQHKFILSESEMPKAWYNIAADLPFEMPPVLHPGTQQPITPDDLAPLFPMAIIEQEVSTERFIPIPEAVQEIYRLWRPSPLVRAYRLEKAIGTRSKIYFKNESVSPAGSHKPNTAVAQAYYNAKDGVKKLTTETGGGQWGSALALACNFFGLECLVFMVRVTFDGKPYRKSMIESWGARIFASPSKETACGREILARDPECSGSLGIAISEAVEVAVADEKTKYSLGSVLNHVMLHQTVIGEEAQQQMKLAGDYPDIVIGCVGGGSNFAGISFPFIKDKFAGKKLQAIAVEPTACPSLTKGLYAYDYGDTGKLTPLVAMYTLGHNFIPSRIHAGGLRYHGASPLVSRLVKEGFIEARSYQQTEVFQAAVTFARSEGIIPAPETAHAIRATIDEAKKADEEGVSKTILFNFSGHGHFDMSAYDAYFSKRLEDNHFSDTALQKNLAEIADLPKV
ncbi:MAG: TrpB-like pyridoxal phosphate-dependent enzyme [Candidatus Neomarinimicrobiota bacterium]